MTDTDRRSSTTRRSFIGLVGAAGVSLVAGTARAEVNTDYRWRDGGDEITRRFDRDELVEYLPRFSISRSAREQLIGVYGWIAESEDHDTDAYYYWMRYSHQDPAADDLPFIERAMGVLATDGHLWDHEPSIIFVDPDSGAVEEIVVTGYHHYPLKTTDPPLSSDVSDQETHIELEVIDPWHHYVLNSDKDGADVTNTVALRDFLEVRDQWESRGIFDRSSDLAVDNPFAMKEGRRDSWWKEGTRDARAAWLWHRLGLFGEDETDPELIEP